MPQDKTFFSMDVMGSARRPTNVKKLYVTDLECILAPLFIKVDMFSLIITNILYLLHS